MSQTLSSHCSALEACGPPRNAAAGRATRGPPWAPPWPRVTPLIPAPGQIHSDDFAAATLLEAGSTVPGSRSCSLSRKRPRPRKPVESSSGCDAIATGCPPPTTTTPFHHPPRLTPFSLSRGFQSHQDSSRVVKKTKRFVVVDSEGARGWRFAGVRETPLRRSLPSCLMTSGGRTASRPQWGPHHQP